MSKTILLADDSVTIQKVIELTFMDQDWEVVSVSNGDDAVSKVDEGVGDLVIADVHMPGASGFEVARRSKDQNPDVPVLLLVGTFEPFEESDYEASGADAYLKKPFDSQELLELVEELAAQGGVAGAAAPSPPAAEPAEPMEDEDEMSFSDMELDLGAEDEDLSLGDEADEDEVYDLTDVELGEAEEDTAGLSGGDAVWGNLELEESPARVEPEELDLDTEDEEPELTVEAEQEEAQPFRLSDEPGESFALESEAAPPPAAAETVRMETVAEEPEEPRPEEPREAARDEPPSSEPEPPSGTDTAPTAPATPAAAASSNGAGLSDEDVDRIARRVVDLIGESVLRDVAWDVVPDLAEVVIKDRIRELERQIE